MHITRILVIIIYHKHHIKIMTNSSSRGWQRFVQLCWKRLLIGSDLMSNSLLWLESMLNTCSVWAFTFRSEAEPQADGIMKVYNESVQCLTGLENMSFEILQIGNAPRCRVGTSATPPLMRGDIWSSLSSSGHTEQLHRLLLEWIVMLLLVLIS